jgi:hypothetical protein
MGSPPSRYHRRPAESGLPMGCAILSSSDTDNLVSRHAGESAVMDAHGKKLPLDIGVFMMTRSPPGADRWRVLQGSRRSTERRMIGAESGPRCRLQIAATIKRAYAIDVRFTNKRDRSSPRHCVARTTPSVEGSNLPEPVNLPAAG